MDECSLAMHVEGCPGTVLRSVRGAVRASLSTQRSRMMLLASVATDFGFNALLPQVIIANKTQFSHQMYEVLASSYHGSIEKFGVVPPHGILLPSCVSFASST